MIFFLGPQSISQIMEPNQPMICCTPCVNPQDLFSFEEEEKQNKNKVENKVSSMAVFSAQASAKWAQGVGLILTNTPL